MWNRTSSGSASTSINQSKVKKKKKKKWLRPTFVFPSGAERGLCKRGAPKSSLRNRSATSFSGRT